jgi:putative ABC transport system ATP-binding protein
MQLPEARRVPYRSTIAPMLSLRDVHKTYRTGLVETTALAGFSLSIAAGEFVAVMGPSGSGKTTFLNVAGLLDDFESGDYVLDGKSVRGLSDDDKAELRNRKLGFVFQSFNLIPDLDVFDNVDMPLRYRGMGLRQRVARVEQVLARVGLTSRMRHMPAQLSGGQQQRVAIARALVGEPQILLADEPTGNLDSVTARHIIDLLQQINAAGTTVIMVTHDVELAARASRRLHVLDGKVIDPLAPLASARPAAGADNGHGLRSTPSLRMRKTEEPAGQ